MTVKNIHPALLIANRLDDGIAVFWSPTGWTKKPTLAGYLADESTQIMAEKAALKDVINNLVVGPLLVAATLVRGIPHPDHPKYSIQADGPTVIYGEAEYVARAERRVSHV